MILNQIHDCLKHHDHFLITAHQGPEGDSIGSQLAMYHLLKRMGKHCTIYNSDPVPDNLMFLEGAEDVSIHTPTGNAQVAIVLDCSDKDRTGKVAKTLEKFDTVINIDHHISNIHFGDFNFVDPKASSAAEMVYRLYKHIFSDIDPAAAWAMYTGMYTDTGSFIYSSTTDAVHEVIADLLRSGVIPQTVAQKVNSTFSLEDIQYVGEILSKIKCDENKEIYWVCIDPWKDDSQGDLTDAILQNFKMIKDAKVFVLIKQMRPDAIRINFRSQSDVDVNAIARHFDGGGHAKAAGATVLDTPIEKVEKQIIDLVKQACASLA